MQTPEFAKADAPQWILDLLKVEEPKLNLVNESSLKEFDSLTLDEQERYRNYTNRAVASEIDALQELTEIEGLQWDYSTYATACNLFDLAKAPWSPLLSDEAEDIIREYAPPFDNDGWDEERLDKLINSAFKKVMHSDKARPYPKGETRTKKASKPTTQEKTPFEFNIKWLSEVEDEDYEWYEENWVPKKGLLLLSGDSGSGKSTLFAYWMAQLTTGEWSDKPENVIYLAREDSLESVIKPRLKVAGTDLSKVATILLKEPDFNGTMRERALSFKRHLEPLRAMVRDIQAKAIFLDPVVTFLGVDEDRDSKDMQRTALDDLKHFADEENVLIVCIKHNKKNQIGSEKLTGKDKVYGSTVWYEVFRHGVELRKLDDELKDKMQLGEDDELAALLMLRKNSYGPDDLPPKAFKLESVPYRKGTTSRFVYDGDRNINPNEIDARATESDEQTDKRVGNNNKADKWLIDTLNALGGSALRSKIEELCNDNDKVPSFSTIRRRMRQLDIEVESRKSAKNDIKIWHLGPSLLEKFDPKNNLEM